MSVPLYKVTLTLPADLGEPQVGSLSMCLEDMALATSVLSPKDGHGWRVEWICSQAPDERDCAIRLALIQEVSKVEAEAVNDHDWIIEELQTANWLEEAYRPVPAFSVGAFFIYGADYDEVVPDGQTGLFIEAATAFGSGEHGTTAGCLKALQDLKAEGLVPERILDLGTGSGILALAAQRLWPGAVILATDIEDEAVRVAQRHCEINNAPGIMCLQSDGFAAPAIAENGPYDLIIANILAAPLKEMAADLAAALASGGRAVLSGMLQEQVATLEEVYAAQGLSTKRRYDESEWSALILNHK